MYIILVCIAAYGVVSRALTMYSGLEFTARNLTNALFYRPYWFLYSIVEDEQSFLDGTSMMLFRPELKGVSNSRNHLLRCQLVR